MLDQEIAKLSPEVARIILFRGPDASFLQWQDKTSLGARRALDALDDDRLFGTRATLNEEMAGAVRALLYAWTGWVGEGKMYAQAAAERERCHITAFCERMLNNGNAAKEYYRKTGDSPIYGPLYASALSIIGPGASPEVHRFRQALEATGGWEPHAFCDLYAQAVSGQLGASGVATVNALQNREFELLFCHCYQAATGTDLSRKSAVKSKKKSRAKAASGPQRPAASRGRAGTGGIKAGPDAPTEPKANPFQEAAHRPGPAKIRVICPNCRDRLVFAASARGQKHICPTCNTRFLIPKRKKSTEAVAKSSCHSRELRVFCPKCRGVMTFPDSMRGQKKSCLECGAPFVLPVKRPQTAPSA